MTKPCLRSPEQLLQPSRIGAFHPSYLSFARSLLRTMIEHKWCLRIESDNLDADGFGSRVYLLSVPAAKTRVRQYRVVFFSQPLADELRNDRVIAEQWDFCCCLWRGALSPRQLAQLRANLPRQEQGRYNSRVLAISRANKSLRLFQHTIDCLTVGEQPDPEALRQTPYLARTTAVYGNGKFGLVDYQQLASDDFAEHFRAQMLLVYCVRQFTFTLVEHIARQRGGDKAAMLDSEIKQYLGVGNSTGLGMAPYLINHPGTLHSWLQQREQALYQVVYQSELSSAKLLIFQAYLDKAVAYFSAWEVADARQQSKNADLVQQLQQLRDYWPELSLNQEQLWPRLWQWLQQHASNDAQELCLNMLLECYPEISAKYANFRGGHQYTGGCQQLRVADLVKILARDYRWALEVDFKQQSSTKYFWYRSSNKEEPRLGERDQQDGVELQMQINVAERIAALHAHLCSLNPEQQQQKLSQFLLQHCQYCGDVRRVLSCQQLAYGELRANLVGADCYPIDLLRMKLACFGAARYDPKSERWLRITLFQGAPLPGADGTIDAPDDWFIADVSVIKRIKSRYQQSA